MRGLGLGQVRLGTAGSSPRLRRAVLVAVLLGVAFLPYPMQGAVGVPPASVCRYGCRAGGSVASMVRWTRPLPGSWEVVSGLTGTVPASGLAYASVGGGVAAVGTGLNVYGYSARTGAQLWQATLTGFPAGAAIVSVRTWPGEVTAGVSYRAGGQGGHLQRTEVVISGTTGIRTGKYPAATFGGAVAGSPKSTVIVGATTVTSYDNATGHIRWQRPTGQVAQAWRVDGDWLYMTQSAGGFVGSAPVTGLRKINLVNGGEAVIRPLEGQSFSGALSIAFDGVVLFSSTAGVAAYSGTTGARLWSIRGAVPEGADPRAGRIYLTEQPDLIGVSPLTGRVKGTASGSSVNGSAGVYAVRDSVALGLDQGANGDAWGYDIAAQRVTLAAAGLPWPHYFVDLGGVGGSADSASSMVIIAVCARLAPSSPATPSSSATQGPGSSAGPNPTDHPSSPSAHGPAGVHASGGATSGPPASPPPSASQGCLNPELVALSLLAQKPLAPPQQGTSSWAMNRVERVIRAADRLQQRHAWLAVPVAVWKKFGDDQAGNLAALIAYSALVAIFPLLLLLVTVLDIVLKNDPKLQQKLVNAALKRYPVVGSQLHNQLGHLSQTGPALVVAVIGILIGALGVANSVQNALNAAWEIPFDRRPGFPWSWLRSAALIIVVGTGFIATTILSGLAADVGHFLPGPGAKVLALAVSLVLSFGLFWLAFRLGTASVITWRQMWLGAAISAVVWQVLQYFGTSFVSKQIAHASPLYGTFAIVLGLIAWLYLQAQLTLYAVQINVVRAYRLWPRSLAPPPYTEQDRRAFRLYVEKRRDQLDIIVGPGGEDDREKTPG